MFIGVKCINHQPVSSICISQNCKISPFLCGQTCHCQYPHSTCNIKTLSSLNQDIKTIKKFQFLIVYSPTLKANSIEIMGRFATQTQPPPENHRFCLTYDSIPLFGLQTIRFRLIKIRGCVGVGVFSRATLIKNEFRYIPDGKYLNHGSYMLLSNNMMYSNSRQSQNGIMLKNISLKQKDVIEVRYESEKVIFCCRGVSQMMHVDFKAGDYLHFGVYLYDIQDQIQIINSFVCDD